MRIGYNHIPEAKILCLVPSLALTRYARQTAIAIWVEGNDRFFAEWGTASGSIS